VEENAPEGTIVASVHATDLDIEKGNNSLVMPQRLSFFIMDGNINGIFKVRISCLFTLAALQ